MSSAPAPSTGEKTWSPLFKEPVSADFRDFHECLDQDKRIALYDVAGSQVHADMLARAGIISQADNAAIQKGLAAIADEMRDGSFEWKKELEDVHMNVEQRLTALVGDAGKRLHTARSRNDQNATDVRLYARAELDALAEEIKVLISSFTDLAEEHADTIMPGFTHLQVAQPITFGHHMMAYAEMFLRDLERVRQARARLNYSPLGAAAARRNATIGGETPQSLIRAALAAEPALFDADGNVLSWPDLTHESGIPPGLVARPVVASFARFLPSFDLAPAGVVAELVGALPMPAAPFGSEDAGNPWAKA